MGPGLCLRSLSGLRGACGTEAPCLPGSVWGTLLLTTLFPVLTHVGILKQKNLLGPHENQQFAGIQTLPQLPVLETWGAPLALGSCPSPSSPYVYRLRTDTPVLCQPCLGVEPR